MSNKDIIKYFYEVVVSENLLDELHKYISEKRSIARIPMYQALNTIKIDTNAKTVAMIANEIKQL